MLRVTWRAAQATPRLLSEDELMSELERMAATGFSGLPSGPIVVEGLDRLQRLAWCAHYKTAPELEALLRQLREERSFR
jgi:hypothetical protein